MIYFLDKIDNELIESISNKILLNCKFDSTVLDIGNELKTTTAINDIFSYYSYTTRRAVMDIQRQNKNSNAIMLQLNSNGDTIIVLNKKELELKYDKLLKEINLDQLVKSALIRNNLFQATLSDSNGTENVFVYGIDITKENIDAVMQYIGKEYIIISDKEYDFAKTIKVVSLEQIEKIDDKEIMSLISNGTPYAKNVEKKETIPYSADTDRTQIGIINVDRMVNISN